LTVPLAGRVAFAARWTPAFGAAIKSLKQNWRDRDAERLGSGFRRNDEENKVFSEVPVIPAKAGTQSLRTLDGADLPWNYHYRGALPAISRSEGSFCLTTRCGPPIACGEHSLAQSRLLREHAPAQVG
jgi:hypothetical protein